MQPSNIFKIALSQNQLILNIQAIVGYYTFNSAWAYLYRGKASIDPGCLWLIEPICGIKFVTELTPFLWYSDGMWFWTGHGIKWDIYVIFSPLFCIFLYFVKIFLVFVFIFSFADDWRKISGLALIKFASSNSTSENSHQQ